MAHEDDRSSKEPTTVDETRAARYRREHGEFLEHSLRPLPPLSPPPPPRANGWFARMLWFLVVVYGTFMGIRWLAQRLF